MEHPPGWTCEVTLLRFKQYLLVTLTRMDALAVAEHVEACASCAQRLALLSSPAPQARGGQRG